MLNSSSNWNYLNSLLDYPNDVPGSVSPVPSKQGAQGLIDSFRANSGPLVFSPSRVDIADRLDLILNTPSTATPEPMNQGKINLCGPLTFLYALFRHNPRMLVSYVISLSERGFGKIGSLTVKPGPDLTKQVFKGHFGDIGVAEWIAGSSLRDSENDFLTFDGSDNEEAAGMTFPGEIVEWARASGLYTSVEDQTNVFFNKSFEHFKTISKSSDTDVFVFVNSDLFPGGANLTWYQEPFPTHWVLFDGNLKEFKVNGEIQLTFDAWTWGKVHTSNRVSADRFEDLYYGYVIAKR